jgi:hypothetical protein
VQFLQDELKQARMKLKQVATDSSQRVQSLQEQLSTTQANLQQELSSRRIDVDRLKAVQKEMELQSTKQSMESAVQIAQLKSELSKLEVSLKAATQQSTALRGEKMSLRKELALKVQQLQRYENISVSEVAIQTDTKELHDSSTQTEGVVEAPAPPSASVSVVSVGENDGTMTDRLGRIRDAADRAALMQEYRRELSRIKADYQAEILKVEQTYNENLQRVIKEARAEVTAQTKEYKRQIKSEWDSKVASLDRKHQQEIKRVRWIPSWMFSSPNFQSLTIWFCSSFSCVKSVNRR